MNQHSRAELQELYEETGLSSHMEDYMEAIAMLTRQNKVVRVKDIAKKLHIKMPSVTAALNKLKDMELIEYEKYGFIELTDQGKTIADRVYNKHSCLSDFFSSILQLNAEKADSEACKVEHMLNTETCIQLHRFLDFLKEAGNNDEEWFHQMVKMLQS